MPKYLIERTLPGAGQLTPDELVGISAKSAGVVRDLGPGIQWVHTYVTDDKLNCVYVADDADVIREHARRGGFPCDQVTEVKTMIEPVTAEG